MMEIQHDPYVKDRLVASSDAEHLPRTTEFDVNQNVSNTAPTEIELLMDVDPPNALPRPANFSKEKNIALVAMILIVFVVVPYQVKRMHADESDQPYNKQQQTKLENITNRTQQSGSCVVPANPEYGEYIIQNPPTAKPGESVYALQLTVKCLPDYMAPGYYTPLGNYTASGTDPVICLNGTLSRPYPKCVLHENASNPVVNNVVATQPPASPEQETTPTIIIPDIPIVDDPSASQVYGPDINKEVTSRFAHFTTSGLDKEVKRMHADESDQPYNKQQQTKLENITNRTQQSGSCVVPANPEYGEYIIQNPPTAKPGESVYALQLTVKCLPDYMAPGYYTASGNYTASGTDPVICLNGTLSRPYPKCVRFCKLDTSNTSVRYWCLVTGNIEGGRNCSHHEPSGTVVEPECTRPNNLFNTLPFMRCINGSWDHDADCSSECGRFTSNGVALNTTDGRSAERGELPWHVVIYRNNKTTDEQICGGSIVSNSVVISAAHCFWKAVNFWETSNKQLPASMFAVVAGKIYQRDRDVHAQKSDVKKINIPEGFHGDVMHFQDDIAVLILETPFKYTPSVGPVCLSFDPNFETSQLQSGTLGKVAGWRHTAENGNSSLILKVFEVSYIAFKQCLKQSPENFLGYITSDKICAGYTNGKEELCKGDSGGGLVFLDADRFILRGIVSLIPHTGNNCNINWPNIFTQILIHENFIKKYL